MPGLLERKSGRNGGIIAEILWFSNNDGVKSIDTAHKYEQVRSQLVSSIRSGSYQVGDKLPSESVFVETMRVSRSTVIRALKSIENQGLIERRQGSGSFVTHRAVQVPSARATVGLLRAVQTGRHPDSVADQIQSHLNALLQQRGAALIVHTVDVHDDPVAVAEQLAGQHIAGLFLVPLILRGDAVATSVVAGKISPRLPLVLLDGDCVAPPRRSGFDVVGTENRYCGYLQTRHLLDRGLRRVLYFGSNGKSPTVVERHLGYLDAMRESDIDVPGDWTFEVADDDLSPNAVDAYLAAHEPDGIVCKSDEIAAMLINHLIRLGIDVPARVKVVGFDDRPIASLLPVGLSSIRQPVAEIAKAALDLMDARITQPNRPASRIQMAGELVVRQSSAR